MAFPGAPFGAFPPGPPGPPPPDRFTWPHQPPQAFHPPPSSLIVCKLKRTAENERRGGDGDGGRRGEGLSLITWKEAERLDRDPSEQINSVCV
ncbi:hypothetical protein GWI33_017259 [Rhynchophorus ferrugineus]|uniref:Uncharacterized protein n=1 Tax=Rhynchophorus ferrugineus TaxID=354439 RepID=A0A834M2L2_RHYFE|nr:hypothetical protein GWI33_017259 [Rhynchophorus ferrugineus]